ncbi:MAG: hypothetical protein WCO53_13800 [Deltaproteobacteria bacterium]
MPNIGGNKFEKVFIPLAFEDRYFLVEEQDGSDIWTVITLSEGKPIVEILQNKPQKNPITVSDTNPTGIIAVADPTTGQFIYKLRPGSKNSSIFGKINGKETEIKITDREIRIGTNVFQNNMITGFAVGIRVDKNGGIALGAGLPPELQKLIST